jgi:uncharacterized membrane protein YfcA
LLLLLCLFAFAAGFLDAIVGGGGLIQLPALLIVLPQFPTAALLGTNKVSSIAGTAMAIVQYASRMEIPWRTMLPSALVALVASFFGASLASRLNPAILRPIILLLMIVVAIYTFWKKDFGSLHAPKLNPRHQLWAGMAISGVIGVYDGFFGPGTGSFLIFAFIGWLGFSFLSASASAKVINGATNLGAILCFARDGHVLLVYAIPMAGCNLIGSFLGSRLALQRGAGFVRWIFLLVVSLLIARLSYDLYWKP